MSKRSWTDDELTTAVANARSIRQVIQRLRLVPAGGNYSQVTRRMNDLALETKHFSGKGWNHGWQFDPRKPKRSLDELLVKNCNVQSFKLKQRLFSEGIKKPKCEQCGWAQSAVNGRIPVELDHINGNKLDNRLVNLRVLCPNCHSLKPTHRGLNKKSRYARVL
ncbi:MAG: HNH endonuclease signature motif containing protein [Candidatus Saccharimonadales bacterium]